MYEWSKVWYIRHNLGEIAERVELPEHMSKKKFKEYYEKKYNKEAEGKEIYPCSIQGYIYNVYREED